MTVLVDAPSRVDGVQILGDAIGFGYRSPPALVRRADGQVLQLTPLLHLVLQAADGRRSCAQIAELVGRTVGRGVSEDDVRTLLDGHLRPLGLVRGADGAPSETRRTDPLLGLKPRFAVTNPRTTHLLTDPFRVLFRPVVMAAVVLGFVAVVGWVFFERGLGASAYDAFERPHLLLLVFVVSVLSAGFHEFGHAAAARYSGAEPGVMGAGLYLVWPAFYTDVTDSYRLGRAGRIRTDLGGLYFNAIVVVLTFGWWWWSGWEALLLLVATQVLQMVQQLLPLLRFDGYHLLADLAGVPDLYQRIRPTLRGLLPHRWNEPENRALKPSARVVITAWVLVTVPLMALMLLGLVAAVPRLLGTGRHVVGEHASALADAWGAGDVLDGAGHTLQVLGVVVPMAGCVLILARLSARYFQGLARWSRGSAARRAVAAALGTALVTAVSWAWWPQPGNYEPLQPGDTSLASTLLLDQEPRAFARGGTDLAAGDAANDRLATNEPLAAVFEKDRALPTRDRPVPAIVLVPTDSDPGAGTAVDGPSGTSDGTWVFPFDKPLPPEQGDNQALAVNTTDGSVKYDVAFAMVWVEDDQALNVNEAHAYASCSDCVTVAVAFQVVLIMEDARVVVPQNLAVAANYRCHECITAAIASQLVLSVGAEPGQEQMLALREAWSRLQEFARTITSYSLAEISAQLDAFKAAIIEMLERPPVAPSDGATTAGPEPGAETDAPAAPTPTTSSGPATDGGGHASTPAPSPSQSEGSVAPELSGDPVTTPPPSEEPSPPASSAPSGSASP